MATVCTSADPGYYANAPTTATDQVPCAAGTVSPGGTTSCPPVAAGYYSPSTAQPSPGTACLAGRYSTGGATSCTIADPGHRANAATLATGQVPCAAGTYQPDAGATACLPADVGHYVPGQGATSQLPCPARTVQPSTGASSCIPAPVLPTAPGAVQATAGIGSAVVTWNAPADDGGAPVALYQVVVSPGGRIVTVPGNQTTTTIPGLAKGTSYSFTVSAATVAGQGPSSSPSSAVTTPQQPDRVAAPRATVDGRAVTLRWKEPASGGSAIEGYRIIRDGKVVKTLKASARTLRLAGLTTGRHSFKVLAFNAVGEARASKPRTVQID